MSRHISQTISRVVATTKNVPVNAWYLVWLSYLYGVDNANPISFKKLPTIQRPQQRSTRYPMEEQTSTARPRNLKQMGRQLPPKRQAVKHEHNDYPQQIPRRLQHLQEVLTEESLRAFHPKAQVLKENLKLCPQPSKVGFIMYSANTLQVNILVKNVLEVTNKYIGPDIEVAI